MQAPLFDPGKSPYLVSFDGDFRLSKAETSAKDKPPKAENVEALAAAVARIDKIQRKLYADDRFAILLVFQAMDASGKDGTIRAVLSGVNPAGCEVYNFKAPSHEELDHDFMWRAIRCLPERGRIGVWNRSHYEEVTTVRVNPKFLGAQHLPREIPHEKLWDERLDSIREHEKYWARNGVVVLKFFLNVSRDEQKERLLERIDDPEVNWKFDASDLAARKQWKEYMEAYEIAMNETSRAHAPWYCIPADSKSFMRRAVAEIIADTLETLDLRWPVLAPDKYAEMLALREELVKD
ncbi:MAG TPA: PPK2 family polyphosphate kinase [Kofleriaceae bacterium]|nr:PPK2 family polyphosphate kinase [Kofleriaceae bacterium]